MTDAAVGYCPSCGRFAKRKGVTTGESCPSCLGSLASVECVRRSFWWCARLGAWRTEPCLIDSLERCCTRLEVPSVPCVEDGETVCAGDYCPECDRVFDARKDVKRCPSCAKRLARVRIVARTWRWREGLGWQSATAPGGGTGCRSLMLLCA